MTQNEIYLNTYKETHSVTRLDDTFRHLETDSRYTEVDLKHLPVFMCINSYLTAYTIPYTS